MSRRRKIGAEDDLYGAAPAAKYAAAKAPRSRLVLHETGGHLLVGRDAEVWDEIAAFARALPPWPSGRRSSEASHFPEPSSSALGRHPAHAAEQRMPDRPYAGHVQNAPLQAANAEGAEQ